MAKRLLIAVWSLLLGASVLAFQATPGQGDFVPVTQLPPSEQFPAAPLVVAAYAFAWLAVFFYLWTVWRRLGKVERELHALEQRQAERSHPR